MDLLATAAPRGTVIGRYILLDEIAAGAMATVCLARVRGHTAASDTVSVKRLHAALLRDAEFVATAVDEAWRASTIHHPNLLAPQDVVLIEGRELLFVSPYVPGETLAILFGTCFRSGVRMPPAIAVAVLRDVLLGMHAAHDALDETGAPRPIVHRGVSPQNILVGLEGRARLFDYGLASGRMRARLTPAVFAKGKSSYMSPEQIRRQPVDRRTDIFAAGAILWELLTGERLFRDTGEAELTRQITQHHIPPPSTVQPGLPEALDAIVARALQRSPADRFATAAELAGALEAALPLAEPAQIGQWVEELDSDRLRARAQLVTLAEDLHVEPLGESEIEQSVWAVRETRPAVEDRSSSEPAPWVRPLPVIQRPGTGRRGWSRRTLAGLAVATTAVLIAVVGRRDHAPAPVMPPAVTASVMLGPPPPPAPAPPAPTATRVRSARPVREAAPPPRPAAGTRQPVAQATKAKNGGARARARARAGKASHALLKAPTSRAARERARPSARVATAPRGEAAGAACDPPFTVDADGIRRIKRQCLR